MNFLANPQIVGLQTRQSPNYYNIHKGLSFMGIKLIITYLVVLIKIKYRKGAIRKSYQMVKVCSLFNLTHNHYRKQIQE